MAKFEMIIGVVLAVAMLNIASAQRVHVVGDSLGWTVPRDGASVYQNWAATQQFGLGDTLTFNFETGNHDVVEVPKASFDACTSSNAIGNVITNGPANVTLDSDCEHYYICTVGQHCLRGQKLSIDVSATPGGASPSPTTSPTTPNASSPSSSDNSSSSRVLVGVLVPITALVMGLLF